MHALTHPTLISRGHTHNAAPHDYASLHACMHAWAPTLAACPLWLIIHRPLAQSISNVRPPPRWCLLYYPADVYDSPTSFVHKTNAAPHHLPSAQSQPGPTHTSTLHGSSCASGCSTHTQSLTQPHCVYTITLHTGRVANTTQGAQHIATQPVVNTFRGHWPRVRARERKRVRGWAGLTCVVRCWQLGSCTTQALGLTQACCAYNKGYVCSQGILACGKQRSSTYKHMDTS